MGDSTTPAGRRAAGADSSGHRRERTEKLLDEFRRARNCRLQSGQGQNSPELVFLEKAIRDFETDLQNLQTGISF